MRPMLYTRYAFYLLLLGCCIAACSKMDHTYDQIIKNGEVIYSGKADSLRAYPGKNRIKLSWLLLSDPNITYCKIYWNDGADSLRIPVKRSAGTDTISIIIDSLKEGVYTFGIYTGDELGHSSVKATIAGTVYGNQYTSSLQDRSVNAVNWLEGTTQIKWAGAGEGVLGTELNYTDADGNAQQLFIPAGEDTTFIENYKESTSFEYRTLHLPDSTAIDTFYTDYTTVTPVFEKQLDKSKFSEYDLPTDAVSGFGWVLPRLWDGDLNSGFHVASGTGLPHHYTFDLGVTAQLSRFKCWQRGSLTGDGFLYNRGNLRTFEVWGATDPAPDGSWDGWTKLMDCQSVKPSGLPAGQLSDADKAYAKAGEEFVFPAGTPPVRYIRIKVLSNWGGESYSHTMEMTFWAIEE